jgi:hypothetical protein
MSLNQELYSSVNERIPTSLAQLTDTEKKIGDIMQWCTYNYQNSDKDLTFTKTQEYTTSALTVRNLFFLIVDRMLYFIFTMQAWKSTNTLICKQKNSIPSQQK